MSLLDYIRTKQYIVVAHSYDDLDDIYDELESAGKSPPGLELIRAVECVSRRPGSRGTIYRLTAWEAGQLSSDPRIKTIELVPKELGIEAGTNVTQTSSNWDKSNSNSTNMKNWALLRCTEASQRAGWGGTGFEGTGSGTASQTATISLAQTGKHVDVVIVDGDGLVWNHPEFRANADGTGSTRTVQYNWFQHDPVVKGSASGTYTYSNTSDHATHVAGTVAGNTQGWARDANIYNIYYYAGAVGDSNFPYVIDYVREFHRNKSINPATGRRNPTICNNSWGMSIFPAEWSFSDITAVTYRGTRNTPFANPPTTYSGASGVYSSNALLANFTGNPENIAQRISTTGGTGPSATASFTSVPASWTQSGSYQAYIFGIVPPAASYTVLVQGPGTVSLRNNTASGGNTGTVTLSSSITITSPSGVNVTYSDGPETGLEVETDIQQTYVMANNEVYTINYITNLNTSASDAPLTTFAMYCTIETSGGTSPTATVTDLGIQSIGSTTGLTSSTTPTVGNNDDGYWTLNLPFNVTYLGTNHSTLYFGTNTYLTFGGGSTIYYGIDADTPNFPKIMVGSDDNSVQRIYYGTEGSAPNRTYRVIIEGNGSVIGTLGNPGMRYQYTFYEATPTQIDLVIGQNNRKTVTGQAFTTGQLNTWGFISGQRIPVRVAALDADIEDAIDEGIIFVGAAGNGRWKHDVPGGTDWNNTFEMGTRYPGSVSSPYYYMRGTSPTANDNTSSGTYDIPNICVGAVDSIQIDQKVLFSDCGPGVDIWAPGTAIISALPGYASSTPDPRSGSHYIGKYNGTSMASPQICGVIACALEIYPNMTQTDAKAYVINYAKQNQLTASGSTPTDGQNLQGAPNLFLFYYKERQDTGNTYPKINYKIRPATGAVYPRPRIKRTL